MERESMGQEPKSIAVIQDKPKTTLRVMKLFFVGLILGAILAGLIRDIPRKDKPTFLPYIIFAIVIAVPIVLRMLPSLFDWTIGTIDLVQIFSPEFEQRARTKYQTQTAQLTDLGFDLLFFVGDSISLFRLILIFPAIVVFDMWRDGVPMTVQNGTRLLTGNPVFISRDKSAYAHPSSLGFTFHTRFQDGTILVSKNFGDDSGYIAAIVGNTCPAASASGLWASHQKRMAELVSGGKQVDRLTSFQAYREIVLMEQMHR